MQRALLAVARAHPAPEVLMFLADFAREQFPKAPEMTLLESYFLGYAAYFNNSKEVAATAIKRFQAAPEAVLDDQSMQMSPEAVYSLSLAVVGRIDEANGQTADDAEAELVVKLLLRNIAAGGTSAGANSLNTS